MTSSQRLKQFREIKGHDRRVAILRYKLTGPDQRREVEFPAPWAELIVRPRVNGN